MEEKKLTIVTDEVLKWLCLHALSDLYHILADTKAGVGGYSENEETLRKKIAIVEKMREDTAKK